jgi:NAD(P)-dependent dehydrogenase (short-subunit alcohol dehydrogenase family)
VSVAIDLEGKTYIVAGAGGGGIGTAVCRYLVTAGARIVALDIDESRLAAAAALGSAVEPRVCDVRDPAAVEDACAQADRVDGLVHVAGGLRLEQWAATADVPLSVFDDVVELNLRAAFVTSQVVARRLATAGHGGAIVYVASTVATSAMPFGAAYATAKAGMLALTRTQAVEWGRHGVRVNAVAAGYVSTPKNAQESARTSDADPARTVIPLRRRAKPDDIAAAALYLCSDLAGFVTGHTLVVDGGTSVRPSFLDDHDLPVFVTDDALRERLRFR